MVPSRRERLREATLTEIKSIARQQMAEQGVATISLRAIAVQMGMAAPSLYNYFKNRDDLVTALILDTFNAQADRLEEASRSRPAQDYAGRFEAACSAYREWNLAHPTDFALILGKPIPGYELPAETLTPAARRSLAVFVELFQAAWQEGRLRLPVEYADPPTELRQQLELFCQQQEFKLDGPVLHLVLTTWAHLLGLLVIEVYGHYQPILANPGELYRFEVQAIIERLGLTQPE